VSARDGLLWAEIAVVQANHIICLLKIFKPAVTLVPAPLNQYPMIQNMTQLYVYDASKQLGFSLSEDGLYNPKSYQCYCEDDDKNAR